MMLLSMLTQAAVEAVRSDPVTWPVVGLATVAAVGSWLSIIYANRKLKSIGNGTSNSTPVEKPGMGETCREHEKAISILVESKKSTDAWLARIDGKVDALLLRKG